jgi:hypothetical protein
MKTNAGRRAAPDDDPITLDAMMSAVQLSASPSACASAPVRQCAGTVVAN